jgi:hypothetical protein
MNVKVQAVILHDGKLVGSRERRQGEEYLLVPAAGCRTANQCRGDRLGGGWADRLGRRASPSSTSLRWLAATVFTTSPGGSPKLGEKRTTISRGLQPVVTFRGREASEEQ